MIATFSVVYAPMVSTMPFPTGAGVAAAAVVVVLREVCILSCAIQSQQMKQKLCSKRQRLAKWANDGNRQLGLPWTRAHCLGGINRRTAGLVRFGPQLASQHGKRRELLPARSCLDAADCVYRPDLAFEYAVSANEKLLFAATAAKRDRTHA